LVYLLPQICVTYTVYIFVTIQQYFQVELFF
jgi:hypothetical protein